MTPVAATPPTLTVAPLAKLVPVSVIVVPPAVEPDAGEMLPMVGGGSATNVKAEARVLDRPSIVTVTSAAPAARAPVVAWIVVLLTNFTLVAGTPPIVTVAPSAKLAPLTVTGVPPAVGPDVGDTPRTVGPTPTGGFVGPLGVSAPPQAVSVRPASTKPANAPRNVIVEPAPRPTRRTSLTGHSL